MRIANLLLAFSLSIPSLDLAFAQTPSTPPSAPENMMQPADGIPGNPYSVKGFRTATFGMSKDQVFQAIERDFKIKPAQVKTLENTVERTVALVATVDKLDPGPGPATVTYILGANTNKLIHVNVAWVLPGEPSSSERARLVTAGVQLSTYFRNFQWKKDGSVSGVPVGTNSLILFAATDMSSGGVEIRADGVPYERVVEGKKDTSPDPKGGALLRISYSANITNPDVYKIEQGKY